MARAQRVSPPWREVRAHAWRASFASFQDVLAEVADSGRTRDTINSATSELARKGLIEPVSPGTFNAISA
jgi:hypothetical protein